MDNEANFLKVIEDTGFSTINNERLKSDLCELEEIRNSLPKDHVFSVENLIKLERSAIRGMNICDYWIPIIHVVSSEQEVERDLVKNRAYINAGKDTNTKYTADMKKAYSEADETYNKLKILVERFKGIKLRFEKSRDTFKSAIFIFKDQLDAYKFSDKGNTGTNINHENKNGEIDWND